MADVLALVDDLFFQSKLIETARQVGVTLKIAGTGAALIAAAAAQEHKLVLIDLNARQGALDAVSQLHNTGNSAGNARPIIGFLSHVQVDLAEKALAAGCQSVLPRSKFTAELPQILGQAKT